MKKFFLLGTLLLTTTLSNAQTFCVTTVDVCCNANASTQSATTTVKENDLILMYNASDEDNELSIVLLIDGADAESWNVCGCGSRSVTVDPIASGHVVSLKVLCNGCNSPTCHTGEAKASVFSNVPNSNCKVACQ